jgi:hypothetical protein
MDEMAVDVVESEVDDCREERVGVFSESISDAASSARYASAAEDVDLADISGTATIEVSACVVSVRVRPAAGEDVTAWSLLSGIAGGRSAKPLLWIILVSQSRRGIAEGLVITVGFAMGESLLDPAALRDNVDFADGCGNLDRDTVPVGRTTGELTPGSRS